MRLNKIKLSGFKSFVDTTQLPFPSQRVGIVGPNGCGKSNIIDAIRWVMGESAAKQLRGAAMTDVIFNGSQARKPSNYALVELTFSAVKLAGYPDEIVIKRQLDRAGQSEYFLNETRCRRKDIKELFLGTGLGPRSYAIIEQGMISRFIDAKPEELRNYLEEAAAISKYKERRKESEQRMEHTRQNLARLDEIRQELQKQLDKLQRQLKQAEKYQALKHSEHLLNAQLQALRWNRFDIAVQTAQQTIAEQTVILQDTLQKLHNFEHLKHSQQAAYQFAQTTLGETQARFYDAKHQVDRLTQQITHLQQRHQEITRELTQLNQHIADTQHTLQHEQQRLPELATKITATGFTLNTHQEQVELTEQALQTAEENLETWQIEWDNFNQRQATPIQAAQVERVHLQNLEQRITHHQQRLQRLTTEEGLYGTTALTSKINQLQQIRPHEQAQFTQLATQLATQQTTLQQLKECLQVNTLRFTQTQSHHHRLTGQLSSLQVLQTAALGNSSTEIPTWLQQQGLEYSSYLVHELHIETGWERAVEIVLHQRLHSICIDDLNKIQPLLQTPPQWTLALFETEDVSSYSYSSLPLVPLLEKLQAPWPLTSLLGGVWTAQSLEQAYAARSQLTATESIITANGIWLGPHWLLMPHTLSETDSIFIREQTIKQVERELSQLDQELNTYQTELNQQHQAVAEQERQREQLQQAWYAQQQKLADIDNQLSSQQAQYAHIQAQQQRVAREKQEVLQQLNEDETALHNTREQLYATLEIVDQLAEEREELAGQRQLNQEQVARCRGEWQLALSALQSTEVNLQAAQLERDHVQQSVERLNAQLQSLRKKATGLQQDLAQQELPLEDLHAQLATAQQQQTHLETAFVQAKQTVAQLEIVLNDEEGQRQSLAEQVEQVRTQLEQLRMAAQADEIHRQTIETHLASLDLSPIALLAELPEHADETSWQAQIEAVERKLQQIGAVNLAALEEYKEQAERQQYLDTQAADLQDALNLLEHAITKIDQEIRTRFRHTLEQINQFLQQLFPRLFGGGQAQLTLTHDDVLTAGVMMMAQPPGKKNTHIHLLSGGEKALTAMALIFAIFELNPAPFCVLDEVDAPLDDTNVQRFCTLVKVMSERVQFIFITHNKITMEIAEQLLGVTMQEPGVSRLVAVDMQDLL